MKVGSTVRWVYGRVLVLRRVYVHANRQRKGWRRCEHVDVFRVSAAQEFHKNLPLSLRTLNISKPSTRLKRVFFITSHVTKLLSHEIRIFYINMFHEKFSDSLLSYRTDVKKWKNAFVYDKKLRVARVAGIKFTFKP